MTATARTEIPSYTYGGATPPLREICIGRALDEAAIKYPDHDGLVVCHQARRYCYRGLKDAADLAARGFLSLGISAGDRVGMWSTNSAEWVLTQFATAKIGATLVAINPLNRARELEYVLRQSECQTLVLIEGFRDASYPSILREVCPALDSCAPGQLQSEELPYLRNIIFAGGPVPRGMISWDDLQQRGAGVSEDTLRTREGELTVSDAINIQYTSGTTGFPKGATLSHHNLVNNGLLIASALRLTSSDRLCIPVPFYHCFGMVLANMACVVSGATMVVPAPHFDAGATLQAIQDERCTAVHGVPTMFIAELNHPAFHEFDLRSLRTGIMSGAPCPIEIMRRVVDEMHCRELTIAYGQTEASPVITLTTTDDPLEVRCSTVGKALPHTEVKIIDRETGHIVPVGTAGELCTRGYLVMKGYYKNPAASGAAIDADGWLHTGDLAVVDEAGYFKITGRARDVIIRGGENVYPREIEDFLYTWPIVTEAQIIGVPDTKYGEEIVAWVKLKPGAQLSLEELQGFCRGKIADYKIPRFLKVVDAFPMTVTGKIQKFVMREISTRELDRTDAQTIATA